MKEENMSGKNIKPTAQKSLVEATIVQAGGSIREVSEEQARRIGLMEPAQKMVAPRPIEEISLAKAVKMGLMHPARRVNGKLIPAVPKGMGVFAKIAIQIKDRNGRIVPFRSPKTGKMVRKLEAPCHSFNRQFGFFTRGYMQNLDSSLNTNETLTDDTGATFQTREKGSGLTAATRIISALAKIKFGNSSAALSTTQTNLQGILLGPTTEASVAVTLVVEDSVNTIFTVVGQITNGTGGTFTVQEMGLFPELQSQANVANNTTMFLRDLTGAVPVNNGQTIIGTYTFTIAV